MAYLLLQTATGAASNVAGALAKVGQADLVSGPFDIVLGVEDAGLDDAIAHCSSISDVIRVLPCRSIG